MIGLDTNVLVRFLTDDDAGQSARANSFIKSAVRTGEKLQVNNIVLCELVWVLEDAYETSRSAVGQILEDLLLATHLAFESKDDAWSAVSDYRAGKADFADYLIGRVNLRSGCKDTVTFDRSLNRVNGYRVL